MYCTTGPPPPPPIPSLAPLPPLPKIESCERLQGPYPFGVDPVWHGTKSELSYLNSVKMKLSILLGALYTTSQYCCLALLAASGLLPFHLLVVLSSALMVL